ncbi:MAG TPA: SDR family NAD(P)-dependent oxidoreductase, partial [Terriglobales bacterium]|nr:SDR family NAD(P)-dependent oxidoreductase [Terriglobales bacterium]
LNLVLAARREDLIEELARKCGKRGAQAIAVKTDVSRREDVERPAEAAVARFGRIDVWINNAGVGTFGRYEQTPIEEHEQIIRTNLLGSMYGSWVALKEFRRHGQGILINVASMAGISGTAYAASYSASKHGMRGLGMSLRSELKVNGENDVHVCTVMPTSMDTPFFQHAGTHTGHPVHPIPPVYDPKLVIDMLYKLAYKPEDEVVIGTRGKVGRVVGKVAPKTMETVMGKNVHRAQMEQEETAPESPASVFEPVEYGDGVRGGWKKGGVSPAAVGLVAGVAVAGALLWKKAAA